MIINVKKLLRYLKYVALIILWVSWLASFSHAWQVEMTFDIPDTLSVNNSAILTFRNVNFSSQYNAINMERVFYVPTQLSSNQRNRNVYFFAWYNWKPYMYSAYVHDNAVSSSKQWFPTKMCITTPWSWNSCSDFSYNIDSFLNDNWFNKWYISYWNGVSSYDYFRICFSNDLTEYCFQSFAYSNWWWWYSYDKSLLSGSLNVLSYKPDDVNRISWSSSPIYWWNVPIQTWPWLDDYTYISVWTWDYVDYFENELWFNYNMCFVWTTDLISLYEDRIPYYQWTWYSIFDVYNKLFSTSNMKISKVWTFLNTWLINYRTWFLWENRDINNVPLYNASYSLVSGFQLEYGSWLVNPFLWNKAVYYFIPSTLIDLNNSNVDWEQVAFYCYKKLVWEWNYSWWSNVWLNNNITDDHNKAYDNRTAVYKRNKNNSSVYFSWANIIESQSWDWTPLDYFEWEENLDFSSFFSNAFNKFRDNYWSLSVSDSIVWVLPNYIVLFLLAVILFKFLRK